MDLIYIETTVTGNVAGRIHSSPDVASRQRTTRAWWTAASNRFELAISQLVIGERGDGDPAAVILDLRADGTARSRSIHDETNAIQCLKYRRRGEEFSVHYSAKPDEYLRRVNQAVFGMAADCYDSRKLSNSELELIDPASGKTFVFTRTDDSVLAAAP